MRRANKAKQLSRGLDAVRWMANLSTAGRVEAAARTEKTGLNRANIERCARIWDCGYVISECRRRIDILKQDDPSITEDEIRAGLNLARDWQDQRAADRRDTGGAYVNVAGERR